MAKRIGGKIIPGTKDNGKIKKIEWIDINKFKNLDFRPKIIAERLKKDYRKGFSKLIYFTERS